MAENSQFAMKIVNIHQPKIEVVKFNGVKTFEVMDALTTSNLENALRLEENPEETFEKDWNKMNRMVCGIIRSYLTQDIKYHVMIKTTVKNI